MGDVHLEAAGTTEKSEIRSAVVRGGGDGLREARAVVWKTWNKSQHFRFDARTDDAGSRFA